jgi:aspartyl-tRNA(Asn)/glutamyl-tRNA(Gln) amidotransferase subunit C
VSVSLDDVRHIAALARLGLNEEHARAATAELNTILAHMEVLSRVDTTAVPEAVAASASRLPLRADDGPALPLAVAPAAFAPEARDGFFLVPRLATHEDQDSP